MAKRRSSRGRSRSGRGRSGGGESGWKKSKGLAGGLILVIVLFWIHMLFGLFGGGGGAMLEDFPYTYMTEESHKLIIKKADSNDLPTLPFRDDETGEYCWEAWVCNNEECPHLRSKKNKEKKPYIFPYEVEYLRKVAEGEIDPNEQPAEGDEEMMDPEMYEEMPQCPRCKKKKKDSYQVDRYQTEEGNKMMEELRKKFEAKRKG